MRANIGTTITAKIAAIVGNVHVKRIRFMHTMVNDLERIADIYYQVSKLAERMQENDWPTAAQDDMRLEKGEYSPKAGVIFIDILNRLERIGDHVLNVNESASCQRLKATRIIGGPETA